MRSDRPYNIVDGKVVQHQSCDCRHWHDDCSKCQMARALALCKKYGLKVIEK